MEAEVGAPEELRVSVTDQVAEASEVAQVLKLWEDNLQSQDFDPVIFLTRLAEIIEGETDEYIKLDPDPFDDRHPSRTHPSCALGHSLKVLFKKETFMSKLVHDYLRETWGSKNEKVNTAAARLFVDILPGLETSLVYQETEGLISRLFGWAEFGPEPLRSYALGLLGISMELPDVASRFKEKNMHLVPVMLSRLRSLQEEFLQIFNRPFAQFSTPADKSSPGPTPRKRKRSGTVLEGKRRIVADILEDEILPLINDVAHGPGPVELLFNGNGLQEPEVRVPPPPAVRASQECSSSSWAVMESNIIGTWKVFPITLATRQIFMLRYLSPLGEYQEMLSYAFENNAVTLILNYFDTKKDSRLTFEAIKYLSALLCHKKFALEFINCGGLQKMLQVPRPSIAATGVSLSLYYIAYAEDAMERVCLMPKSVLINLVSYVMWLMECSHNSGRNHAIMFFGVVYPFRIMLELFDSQDGLRRILNVIATQPNFLSEDLKISEEDQAITRQAVRQVSYNLKRYFECHLGFLGEKLRRMQQMRGEVTKAVIAIPYYKPISVNDDRLRELNDLALESLPLWGRWHPVEKFLKMGGLHMLLQVITLAYDWNYSGRADTMKSVLEVLSICCLFPRVQLQLMDKFTLHGGNNMGFGMSIILSAAEGDVISEPDVRRAALIVIGNCVCGSMNRPILDPVNPVGQQTFLVPRTATRPTRVWKTGEDVLNKMWECVRVNNGILILTSLLHIKVPITDADSIRALAAWCLAGISRYPPVRQVLEQLPLIRNGHLQALMREPVLQEKRTDHVMFQKYGLEIIKLVYGKLPGMEYDLSVMAMHKSDLISQTKIQYNERQLLQLIHSHLVSKGLGGAAAQLAVEGKLDVVGSSGTGASTSSGDGGGLGLGLESGNCLTPSSTKGKIYMSMKGTTAPAVTLDGIVREYLTNQHALCKTPMAACPTFDLVVPHKCPAIKNQPSAINFTARFSRLGWTASTAVNRKLIYSRFKPFRVLRSETEDYFTSCAFSPCYQWIIVGTNRGEVKLFNNVSGTEDGSYACHEAEIYHVQPNRKGNLLLTSNLWRNPLSALWRTESVFDRVMPFEKEEYVEFSKISQDKIIGTNMDHAFLYDIETSKRILTMEPQMSNQYIRNRATLDPTDSLVLSDGVLWDVNSGKEIFKFDKLNENINGVFHPNGLEVICNSEVWDIRTLKLLQTVRATDQSLLTFTNDGNVIYGIKSARETPDGFKAGDTSFVTLDAGDYSSIGTIELKRSILSLATSPNDLQIALVENHGSMDGNGDSCIRYYEVGRSRYGEDEAVDEEDEDLQSPDTEGEDENDDDMDDDDDDDDDDQEDLDRILDELLPEDEMIELDSSQDEDTEEDAIEVIEASEYEVDDDDEDDERSLTISSGSDDEDDDDWS